MAPESPPDIESPSLQGLQIQEQPEGPLNCKGSDHIGTPAATRDASRSMHLLDLPNEILLSIFVRVPASSIKDNIVTLRLVNKQVHGLLTDEASLRQLRNEIAGIQYPHASLFCREEEITHGPRCNPWKRIQRR